MHKGPSFFVFIFSFVTFSSILAQENLNSPYSRFGLGEMAQPGQTKSRAMGGAGLGLRDDNQINNLNPASYTSRDSLSFLFDFGVNGSYRVYESQGESESKYNSNLDHFALAFPITKWWAFSTGVLPYSSVGYSIKEVDFLENIGAVDYFYSGSGGINKFYLGTAFDLFSGFSIGANFTYLFGSIDLQRSASFPFENDYSVTSFESTTHVADFIVNLGLQYQWNINEKHSIILGGIFDYRSKVSSENRIQMINVFPGNGKAVNDSIYLDPIFLLSDSTRKGNIVIPDNLGIGISYLYMNKLQLCLDYYQQDWSESSFFDSSEPLTNSNHFHLGMEYTPNPDALRGYHKKMHYRVGGHYENSYLRLNEEQLKDYGISFGVGLPFRNTKSSFNLACELGRRGTLENNLIREKYAVVSFSVTLHDFWFYKQKYD